VGNEIGRFLHIDPDVLRREDKRVGYMMVEVDIHLVYSLNWIFHGGGEIIVNRLITGLFRLDVHVVIKRDISVNNVLDWISLV
jgi:hypothetical protein